MTPGEVRDEIAAIQEHLRGLEVIVTSRILQNTTYVDVKHEVSEAWDSLQRATETLDEMVMGVT